MLNIIRAGGLCLGLAAAPALAEAPSITLGVLTDFSGPYMALAGEGSVLATKMAVEDCLKAECKGMAIKVIQADHQNKADLATSIAKRWIDEEHVDAFVDITNASVQLAMQPLVRERNRVALFPGGTARLSNEDCSPQNSVQWLWETYSQVATSVRPLAKPGTKWFFITVDYAFGQALQADAVKIIEKQGGTVVGSVRHPLNTADFASYLVQAQASGADYIAFADAGKDVMNAMKQADEFGLRAKSTLVALFMSLADVKGLGLPVAHGTVLTEAFYWNIDEGTRAWSKRFAARYDGRMPTVSHGGDYSAVLHYLRAVAASGTNEAKAVVAKMHELPIHDEIVRNASLREDGRMVHDTYLLKVKEPAQSVEANDVYDVLRIIPGVEAVRPLAESACPALRRAAQ